MGNCGCSTQNEEEQYNLQNTQPQNSMQSLVEQADRQLSLKMKIKEHKIRQVTLHKVVAQCEPAIDHVNEDEEEKIEEPEETKTAAIPNLTS